MSFIFVCKLDKSFPSKKVLKELLIIVGEFEVTVGFFFKDIPAYVFPYLKATSTGTSPVSFLTVMTLLCSGLLCSSKYFTKSLSPPLNLKELFSPSSVLSSNKTISNPLFK